LVEKLAANWGQQSVQSLGSLWVLCLALQLDESSGQQLGENWVSLMEQWEKGWVSLSEQWVKDWVSLTEQWVKGWVLLRVSCLAVQWDASWEQQ